MPPSDTSHPSSSQNRTKTAFNVTTELTARPRELQRHSKARAWPGADAMPDHVLRGEEAGFAHYLTKPIDLKELQAAVFEVLDAA